MDEPIILGDATLEHLRGSTDRIRATYWEGVVHGGFTDPFVLVIHNRSAHARAHGLQGGPVLQYQLIGREEALARGLIPEGETVVRPPIYPIFLATGDRIQRHVVLDATPSGALDNLHFEPDRRAAILAAYPELVRLVRDRPELLERPWLFSPMTDA
jgi:hypothetical protein